MDKYGVTIQPFLVANSGSDATEKAHIMLNERGAEEIVLKAQILAGGRGKGTFSSGLKGVKNQWRLASLQTKWSATTW